MTIASFILSTVLKPVHDVIYTASQEIATWAGRIVTPFLPTKEKEEKRQEKGYGRASLDGLPDVLYSRIGRYLELTDCCSSLLASKTIFKQKKQLFFGNDMAVSQLIRSVDGDIRKLLLLRPDQFQNPIEQISHFAKAYLCPLKSVFSEKEFKDICKTITTLDLQDMCRTPDTIKQLSDYFPNLEVLDISTPNYRDDFVADPAVAILEEVVKFDKLKALKLPPNCRSCQSLGDYLTKLTALEHFQISNLRSEGIEKLAVLTQLRSLTICCFSDADLEIIRHMPHLQSLSLEGSQSITAQGIQTVVESAKELRALNIAYCESINDAALEKLPGLKHLQRLNLAQCSGITDVGVGYLAGCGGLTHLILSRCRLTNISLETIGTLTLLEDLNLSGLSMITDDGIRHLINFKNLKTLILDDCYNLTQNGIALMLRYTMLEKLDLSGCSVEDNFLRRIGEVCNLKTLALSWCKKFTYKGAAFIQTLKKLQVLDLSGCNGVNNDTVECCSHLPDLQQLNLVNCQKVTPFALQYLTRLKRLRYVNIRHIPGVTEDVINELKSKNPRLYIASSQ